MRVVTLLPSATEMVCALGLQEHLVGVSHECDFPAGVHHLPKVTHPHITADKSSSAIDAEVRKHVEAGKALYSLDIPLIQRLAPDVIVTQSICDVCAVSRNSVQAAISSLPNVSRVVDLAPTCLQDLFQGIQQVAEATQRETAAEEHCKNLQHRIDKIASNTQGISLRDRPSVVVLEWLDPPFSAGHWNPELVRIAGGRELVGSAGQPSRQIEWKRILELDPEYLILACCGFSALRTQNDLPAFSQLEGLADMQCNQNGQIYITDGSAYFNRPGPRLIDSLEVLAHVLHPQIHHLPTHAIKPIRCGKLA